ncbi:MAG TPA: Ig-like domain-containing protein [Gammaproteobacteria bacterium]|nr:Ig-like domain-containing protein [Gammaproteobacteria bacterium]
MKSNRPTVAPTVLPLRSEAKRTPVAIAVGLALAAGMPLAQAAAPAPGAALGGEFQVNTHTSLPQQVPAVAMDATGDAVVVWASDGAAGSSDYGIFAQRYDRNGNAVGSEFKVNTDTFRAASSQVQQPVVAMDAAGDFVVVWSSYDAPSDFGVFAQRYQADGTPAGTEFHVNLTTSGKQNEPAVAMDAVGDFVIAWSSYGQDGDGNGVFARRYKADGTPLSGELQVNTQTIADQQTPAVAMDADGDFVVAWVDYQTNVDGSYFGIFARPFEAGGVAVGTEFQVNSFTTLIQSAPTVAMDADGDFIVAWQTKYEDAGTGDLGIAAQRFQANGAPAGSEFIVNTTTTGDQENPAVAMDAAGNFVVAWTDYSGADAAGDGIFAQRYHADGTPLGSEFQVNTHTSGDQISPAIATDAAGDFVVAWEDHSGEDGDGYGIFGQRYARETSLDLKSTLAVAPADAVEPSGDLTLTAGIANLETASALTGNAAINAALTAASGLTATLTFPDGITFDKASGTNWSCPAAPAGNTLTCTYSASLGAASTTENLVVNLTAPDSAGVDLAFGSAVFGGQPDAETDNNTASASIVTDNAPVATNASLTLNEGATGSGTLKATDADGDSLTFGEAGAPAHGSVKIDADGSYTYTPAAGYSGADSFTFKANDGKLDSNAATVSITVKATQGSTSDDDTDGSSPPPSQPGTSSGGDGGSGGSGSSGSSGGGGAFGLLGLALIGVAGWRRRRN